MGARPDWHREGRDWPNRAHSRFVRAAGIRWHVQVAGEGPACLLLHGTGGATHSWRDVLPVLAGRMTVVAPDLPGHGFTEMPALRRMSLGGMADAVGALLATLGLAPAVAVGHSAGAAIAVRTCLDGRAEPAAVVSLNGAFLPFGDERSAFYSGFARFLALNPLVPRMIAFQAAGRGAVERFMRRTGSAADPRGADLYRRLFSTPQHVGAALGMMAHADFRALLADLPRLSPLLVLAVASRDAAVPPSQAARVREILPAARIEDLGPLGHLAHEERPREAAELVLRTAREAGAIA
jgi:magnesium chelatase accessory protein